MAAFAILDRLPITFASYVQDQIQDWDLLFPAERGYYERFCALLERSEPGLVAELFAPLREAERKMGVTEKTWPRRQFTLDQVDFLNRSPHYPEWRGAVASVFSRLDPLLDAEVARVGRARLVIVLSPAELPVGPDRMWQRLQGHGKRVRLEDSGPAADTVANLVRRYTAAHARSPYDAWIIEAGQSMPPVPGAVSLSYARLERYRARLMAEVRKILESQEIRGPRQLGVRLKQLKVLASETDLAGEPLLAEFLRAVLLSGNGTLLINNTFVEWAAVQAVRRARPSLLVAAFGIRNKIKPFSSLLIYADQESSNPIPTQMDTLGSYVDLEVLYDYVWQEFEKYAEYRRNTAFLFVGEGLDEMLVIAPPDFPLLAAAQPVRFAEVFTHAGRWLNL
jgi:hypothetical protein